MAPGQVPKQRVENASPCSLARTVQHHFCHILLTSTITRPAQLPGAEEQTLPLMEEAAKSHCKACSREGNNLGHFDNQSITGALSTSLSSPCPLYSMLQPNCNPHFPNMMQDPFRNAHFRTCYFLDLKCLFHSLTPSPISYPLKCNLQLRVKATN